MGKDFKTGLMAGAALAGMALIWVATRPSMSPQARMTQAAQPPAAIEQVLDPPARTIPDAGVEPTSSGPPQLRSPEPQEPVRSDAMSGRSLPPAQPGVREPQAGAPDLTVYEMSEPIKTTRFHIVRKGETLSAIAQQYYGSKEEWRKILAANSRTIKDANKIAPGTKLTIPE